MEREQCHQTGWWVFKCYKISGEQLANFLNVDKLFPNMDRLPKKSRQRKAKTRAFLVAQWLRIRLPMQGTRVRALVWEDPTCHGATKPVHHNY